MHLSTVSCVSFLLLVPRISIAISPRSILQFSPSPTGTTDYYDYYDDTDSTTIPPQQCPYVDSGTYIFALDACQKTTYNDSTEFLQQISVKYWCQDGIAKSTSYYNGNCAGNGTTDDVYYNYNCVGSSTYCDQMIHKINCPNSFRHSTEYTLVKNVCSSFGYMWKCEGIKGSISQYDNSECQGNKTGNGSSILDDDGCTYSFICNADEQNIVDNPLYLGLIIAGSVLAFIILVVLLVICCKKKTGEEKSPYSPVHEDETNTVTDTQQIIPNIEEDDDDELPAGWIRAYTKNGRVYYQDTINKKTQWKHPDGRGNDKNCDETQRLKENDNDTVETKTIRHDEEDQLPDGWSKVYTKDGRVYYQDHINKKTRWDHPGKQEHTKTNNNDNNYDETQGVTEKDNGNDEIDYDQYIEVKEFIKETVNITGDDGDKYIKLFIQNGFDSLNFIKTLSDQDLNDIGIKKLGHRKKILTEAQQI